jgi:hypothetical protein
MTDRTMEAPTSAQIEGDIAQRVTRKQELLTRQTGLRKAAAEGRGQLARAIADGKDSAKVQEQIRALELESDGIDGAVQLLVAEIKKLEAQQNETEGCELGAAYQAALLAYDAATCAADEFMRALFETTIKPQRDKLFAAVSEVRRLEKQLYSRAAKAEPNRNIYRAQALERHRSEHDRVRYLLEAGHELDNYIASRTIN